jgi:hypothetical protein
MDNVGTLNQGYPLLQYEDAAPMRPLLATRGTVPDPTVWAATWQGETTHPSKSGPPQKDTGPLLI